MPAYALLTVCPSCGCINPVLMASMFGNAAIYSRDSRQNCLHCSVIFKVADFSSDEDGVKVERQPGQAESLLFKLIEGARDAVAGPTGGTGPGQVFTDLLDKAEALTKKYPNMSGHIRVACGAVIFAFLTHALKSCEQTHDQADRVKLEQVRSDAGVNLERLKHELEIERMRLQRENALEQLRIGADVRAAADASDLESATRELQRAVDAFNELTKGLRHAEQRASGTGFSFPGDVPVGEIFVSPQVRPPLGTSGGRTSRGDDDGGATGSR